MTHIEANAAKQTPNDKTIYFVSISIVGLVVLLAMVGAFCVSRRFSIGVVVGGGVGLLNFLTLARVGKMLTSAQRNTFFIGLIYILKMLALFGGVALLLYSQIFNTIGLLMGLSMLAPAIVVGGLLAAPKNTSPTTNV